MRARGAPAASRNSGSTSTTPAFVVAIIGAYFPLERMLRWLASARSSGATPLTAVFPSPISSPETSAAIASAVMVLAPVSYTHLRAHETVLDLVCRLLL